MKNKKRLIDANAYPCQTCEVSYCYKNCEKFNAWFNKTVDAVEVVHGRWDKYEDDKFIGYDANDRIKYRKVYIYYCGRCGRGTAVKTNYCPNCGAYMTDGDGNE